MFATTECYLYSENTLVSRHDVVTRCALATAFGGGGEGRSFPLKKRGKIHSLFLPLFSKKHFESAKSKGPSSPTNRLPITSPIKKPRVTHFRLKGFCKHDTSQIKPRFTFNRHAGPVRSVPRFQKTLQNTRTQAILPPRSLLGPWPHHQLLLRNVQRNR